MTGSAPEPVRSVLFVSIPAGLGGSARSLITLLDELDGRCQRVVACRPGTSMGTELEREQLVDEVVALRAGAGNRLGRVGDAWRVARWARRHRRNLHAIHANGLSEFLLASPAALVSHARLVVWVHDWHISRAARLLTPVARALPIDIRWTSVSDVARRDLRQAGIAGAQPIAVVPNPIDERVAPHGAGIESPPPKATPDSDAAIVFLGSPARYKGFHLLPDIILELQARGVAARWIIWSGPESMEPDSWARLHALEGPDVRIEGKTRDVASVYEQADIVLCPSFEESFGRVAAEAMANGVPVVASDLPALREVLGPAGTFFPAGDVSAAADRLAEVAGDAGERQRLGWMGYERAAMFAPTTVTEAFAHLYGLPAAAGGGGRALVVSHESTRTGAPAVAVHVAQALRVGGWETTAVVRWPGPLDTDLRRAAGTLVREPRRRLRTVLRRARRTRPLAAQVEERAAGQLLDRVRPDLVWCNTVLASNYIRPALDRRIPVVLHVHELGPVIPGTLRRYDLGTHLDRVTIVTASMEARSQLSDEYHLDPSAITVLESAIDVEDVRRRGNAARDRTDDRLIVGGCGHATPRKGIDLWLDVVALVRVRHPDVCFRWIGRHEPDLVDEIGRRNLGGVVDLVGEQADPATDIAGLAVFTLTSRHDTFALVVLEAMALEVPVVAFDAGGAHRQLGDTGVVVPAGDVEAFADAVLDLLDDPERRRRLATSALDRVRSQFDLAPFEGRVRQAAEHATSGSEPPH